MAGTIKTPLNKRQAKKHFAVGNGVIIRHTMCRGVPVKDDKYEWGHPLAGRVTGTLSVDDKTHVVVTQHHDI